MSKREAKLVIVFAPILLLLVWLIEFVGVLDDKVGAPKTTSAKILRCQGIEQSEGWLKWERKKVVLVLEAAEPLAVRFMRPKDARPAIIALCGRRARVQAIYQTRKPLLRDEVTHKLLGITDLDRNEVVFMPETHDAWKQYNRLWAYVVAGFAFFVLVYGILVLNGALPQRTVAQFKRQVRGYHRGHLRIRSSQRRIEAVIYVALFSGLLAVFGYHYFFKQGSVWLLALAMIPLIALYAYLVELVNVNQIYFEDGTLVYRQGPLPWLQRHRAFPLEQVVSLVAEEETHYSRHGPYTLYAVTARLADGGKETLFFTNTREEADAITVLINERLLESHASA